MKKRLGLTDYLAGDRTHLANRRTLLAYWRTSLAFMGVGAFLIKSYPSQSFIVTSSIVSIIFGILIFIYGTYWYGKVKKHIKDRLD